MTEQRTLLALTMGEPAGIGPEITVKSWLQLKSQSDFTFIYLGCPDIISNTVSALNADLTVHVCENVEDAIHSFHTALPVLPINCIENVIPGKSNARHADAVISSIEKAVELARNTHVSAVVTNPIHKASLKAAGFAYPGHTEFLGHLSGGATPVMMLEAENLRTIPLTRHIPLKEVSTQLAAEQIIETVQIVHKAMQDHYGLLAPRIAVSGLNPHAGEGGVLGHEEADIIIPALNKIKKMGIDVVGPLPADTMFHKAARQAYDVAVCMYHDQALIPVKMLGFETGVNITLGLDFIRTSPDHGTALDIAAQYRASPQSLIAALYSAARMSASKNRP